MTHYFHDCLQSKRCFLFVLIALLYGANTQLKAQACNPDITPPVAVCDQILIVSLDDNGLATIPAMTFDDGSYDLCCLGIFQARRLSDGPCDSDDLPDDFADVVTFCCEDIGGDVLVQMRIFDCAGNFNDCTITVTVSDKVAPDCVPPAHVTVTCTLFDPTFDVYGMGATTDNCCLDTVIATANMGQFNPTCTQGTIIRTFKAYDCSGNSSQCTQKIVVNYEQNFFVKFPNDIIVPSFSSNTIYGAPTFFGQDCEALAMNYEDVVFNSVPDADQRIERTWTILNWCTFNPAMPFTTVPNPNPNPDSNHPENMPGPIVSAFGTPAPWAPTVSKIVSTDTDPTDFSTFWTANNNGYEYVQIIKVIDTFFVDIQGIVFSDSTENCSYDLGEALLGNWTVKATGLTTGWISEVETDANGAYSLRMNGLDTLVNITLVSSGNFGQGCQTSYDVVGSLGQTSIQDFPVHLEQRCALLSVDIATPRLRRCFDNRYTAQACNLSGEMVADAYVEVELDGYLEYQASSIPGTLLSGNTYKFELGDMLPGDCRVFTIDVLVDCAAPLGFTHCTEATIAPFDDCRGNSSWSGADVDVTATCDGDSVRLTITNIGDGTMAQQLDFVVVEDIIMRQSGHFQLNQGETVVVSYEANGSTWRLEAEEEPLHPFGGPQAAALEGCGGLNNPGLVNLFPLSDASPFVGQDCQQNIGSFDPNDKQAFPVGFGSEHTLRANTDIEYMIRFQNTGTDTAFNVVVFDTLSTFLDPASVRVGTSSHYMEFAVLENGVMRFSFPNIALPDSNINEAASNGFLKFRVKQKPDNIDGTRIENRAAIYFDFNDAIFTNTTFHTIGYPALTVAVNDPSGVGKGLTVFPNPTADVATFKFDSSITDGLFELKNQVGQSVRSERFNGAQYQFERAGLQSGVYFFVIQAGNGRGYSGKILVK